MNRVLLKIKKILGLDAHTKAIKERESKTKLLIKNRISDLDRWKKNEELLPNWNERTALLTDYIKPNTHVIEFGAGAMFMKSILKNVKSYTPSDIVKRYPETLVCDLNKPIDLELEFYDVAIFSGVLEYVYDIDKVFEVMRNANMKQIILSYCCSDIVPLTRAKNGWLSDYSKKELETIFLSHNYKIEDSIEWQKQSLYNLTTAI